MKKSISQSASQEVAKFYASGCDENEAYQALLAQHSPVAIHAAEITSIIVKTDFEIEKAIDFLKGLENFTKSEIDHLLIRLSSGESIYRDY